MPTKVHLVKAIVFPVVMYGYKSQTIKKAECWRIDAFELWDWRRLSRVPWTARISNQSIPKEISPEYSLEGLILKLKRQYSGHQMWTTDSLEKTLMLGKTRQEKGMTEDWDGWMASRSRRTWVWASSGSWWWIGKPGVLHSMGLQRVGHNWATELYWENPLAKAADIGLGWQYSTTELSFSPPNRLWLWILKMRTMQKMSKLDVNRFYSTYYFIWAQDPIATQFYLFANT